MPDAAQALLEQTMPLVLEVDVCGLAPAWMGIFLGREHMAEQFDAVLAREHSAAVQVPGHTDYE
jgi:hypothetical protein